MVILAVKVVCLFCVSAFVKFYVCAGLGRLLNTYVCAYVHVMLAST
jgi:hypothetical protein